MNQQKRLINHLSEFKTIDPLEAWRKLGIYRLAAQIHVLRNKGYNIETKDKDVMNSFDERCTVANYVLLD